ncbi:MAG: hypothetical protein AVDCRST_MAG73-1436 [uncultured Thermomicrobiales bacterium]|uniref:Hypervirulence associated protein TUDOR domain-containing protein n=1 Tax=uncultured Thermomicrobiales bacterium TaxID=1645740 RepID=A0A6J4U319_9BACT|nr:MAG: hypothetical protein AVDCRST_MAG73-1436 [uncultured Thermomicrobiales bacterium]
MASTANDKQLFKPGDSVAWKTSQGETTGTVKRKITEPTDLKGHHFAASKDDPEYLVESDKSGAEAIHRPGSLRKENG